MLADDTTSICRAGLTSLVSMHSSIKYRAVIGFHVTAEGHQIVVQDVNCPCTLKL